MALSLVVADARRLPGAPGASGTAVTAPVTVAAAAGSQKGPSASAPKRNTRHQPEPPPTWPATSSFSVASWAAQVWVAGAVASGQARAVRGYAAAARSAACGRVVPDASADAVPVPVRLRALTR